MGRVPSPSPRRGLDLGRLARLDDVVRPDFRRALVYSLLAVVALGVGDGMGGLHARTDRVKLVAAGLAAAFAGFGFLASRSAAREVGRVTAARASASAGAVVRILLSLTGYLVVAVGTLGLLSVPLGRLLVGGAVTGVVLGIAAQQALGNVFAGIVLLLARPFALGDRITVRSGALGGPHEGTIVGLGLLYTTIETADGPLNLPNAGLLSAAVGPLPPSTERVPPAV